MTHITDENHWTARHAEGDRCNRAPTTEDCPRNHSYSDETVETTDALVAMIAELLPFPISLEADMGGTFVLQIDLGRRGGEDDPHDTAGIDPDTAEEPRWWVDIEGGHRSIISEHGIHTDPTVVARWITDTARIEGSPAAEAGTYDA